MQCVRQVHRTRHGARTDPPLESSAIRQPKTQILWPSGPFAAPCAGDDTELVEAQAVPPHGHRVVRPAVRSSVRASCPRVGHHPEGVALPHRVPRANPRDDCATLQREHRGDLQRKRHPAKPTHPPWPETGHSQKVTAFARRVCKAATHPRGWSQDLGRDPTQGREAQGFSAAAPDTPQGSILPAPAPIRLRHPRKPHRTMAGYRDPAGRDHSSRSQRRVRARSGVMAHG